MRILLTGSQGFVGHHLYRYLEKLGHKVYGIDIEDNGYNKRWYEFDLRKELTLKSNFDMVFHLASNVGGIKYLEKFGYEIIKDNILIDLNVINFAKKHTNKLIYFSSSCVYDDNYYGKEKLFTENLIKASGIDYLIVRPKNIYGIEDNKTGLREQVIMALFRKVLSGKKVELYGDGNELRSFIWVEDLFDLIFKKLRFRNKIIDAGGEWISILQLLRTITIITEKNIQIELNKNNEKPKKYIEFKRPKTLLNKGLRDIYKWIKSQ